MMGGGFWGMDRFFPAFFPWGVVGIMGILAWVLFLFLIGLVVFLIVRHLRQPGPGGYIEQETPLDIVKKRYARGELNREEFEQIKRDLQ